MECHVERRWTLIKVFWCVPGHHWWKERWMVGFNEEAPVLEKFYFLPFAFDILRRVLERIWSSLIFDIKWQNN